VAAAFRAGADAAYRAVRRPVEGTILTVAGAMAAAAEAAGPQEPGLVLEAALAAGRHALERTTEQLAALAEAGVVDSGALGLVLLVEGLTTAVTGRPVADPVSVARGGPRAIDHPPSRFRFCTSFLVDGPAIDLAALEARLAGLGDSLLVVGDAQRAKVHLHTDEPPRALAVAAAWGAVDGLAVEDMHRQQAERTRRLSESGLCTAVAVAVGPGHRLLLEGLGAVAVDVDGLPAALAGVTGEAVVLPAGPETAAAAHVAASATGAVIVEDVAGPVAALSCVLAFDPTRPAAENAMGMAEQAAAVAVGAVALDGEEAPAAALDALLRHLLPGDDPAVVTVLVGVEAAGLDPQALRESLAREHPQAEVEVHYGGQPAPVYLVGVER
jgi:dihydroxyacetone kinase-like predicted kinase